MSKARIQEKVGLVIDSMKVTECIFDSGNISNDIALMAKGTELYVFSAITGEFKFKLTDIKKAHYSNDSLIVTSLDGNMGVYDFKKRILVPVIYKTIRNRGIYYVATTYNDTAVMYKRDKKKGKADIVIPEEKGFVELRMCNEGVITGSFSKKHGIYSYEGKELVSPKYDMIQPFGYGYIVTAEEDEKLKRGIYTSFGKKALSAVYTRHELDLPLVYLFKHGKWCAYNMYTNKLVAELKYQRITKFEDAISVTEDNHSFYLRSADTGELLIESPLDKISTYKYRIILLETKDRCNLYYLPYIKKFIDADSFDVKFDDGKYYIRYLIKENGKDIELPWELLDKDKVY